MSDEEFIRSCLKAGDSISTTTDKVNDPMFGGGRSRPWTEEEVISLLNNKAKKLPISDGLDILFGGGR